MFHDSIKHIFGAPCKKGPECLYKAFEEKQNITISVLHIFTELLTMLDPVRRQSRRRRGVVRDLDANMPSSSQDYMSETK